MLAHLYADDVQENPVLPALPRLKHCCGYELGFGSLGDWMSSNRLRLNSQKTRFIWLSTRQQLAKLDMAALAAAFPHFVFSPVVRVFGVNLGQDLTFASHSLSQP